MLGTAICSFGIYNVHDQSGITEGGALGLILLLNHWFGLPSSIATPIIDIICYALAFRALGRHFLEISAFSTLSMAMFFRIWERFPPVLPSLADKPLLAALLGALFIGVGVGIVVRNGGSCGGDDALALFIHKVSGWRLCSERRQRMKKSGRKNDYFCSNTVNLEAADSNHSADTCTEFDSSRTIDELLRWAANESTAEIDFESIRLRAVESSRKSKMQRIRRIRALTAAGAAILLILFVFALTIGKINDCAKDPQVSAGSRRPRRS